MTELILLPGWGFNPETLQPLAEALAYAGIACRIADLPHSAGADLQHWLDELDQRLPPDAWLGGWSLGGMLALALAARRGTACPGVVTLASNACFVASSDWPQAMAAETFASFRASCAYDALATRKRFAMLCAQGCSDVRRLGRELASQLILQDSAELVAGLDVLAAIDNRAALASFAGRQLHLLAADDALVPAEAAAGLLALLEDGEVAVLEQSGHAFLLEQPSALATLIADFICEAVDV